MKKLINLIKRVSIVISSIYNLNLIIKFKDNFIQK